MDNESGPPPSAEVAVKHKRANAGTMPEKTQVQEG